MNAAAGPMVWSSHLARADSVQKAVGMAADRALAPLGGSADLIFVFVSSLYRNHYHQVPRRLAERCPDAIVVGCSGAGIIGGAEESEAEPAVAVMAARLPGVQIQPFGVESSELPDLDASPTLWHRWLGLPASPERTLIVLADPFSVDVENLLRGLDFAWPGAIKIGGLASGAPRADGNCLFLNRAHQATGLVGVSLAGAVNVETVVAQGCRPIGRPMLVTECQDNTLSALDGRSARSAMQEVFEAAGGRDRELMRRALFLGLGMGQSLQAPRPGEFLVRNIVGLDTKRGCLSIGGSVLRRGQMVQFHVRDAQTSAEDLEASLARYHGSPQAALLFSCRGRGHHLYGKPNHDTAMFTRTAGNVPIAGFFSNGEIGPVGGTTYVHGYTSCFGLIENRAKE